MYKYAVGSVTKLCDIAEKAVTTLAWHQKNLVCGIPNSTLAIYDITGRLKSKTELRLTGVNQRIDFACSLENRLLLGLVDAEQSDGDIAIWSPDTLELTLFEHPFFAIIDRPFHLMGALIQKWHEKLPEMALLSCSRSPDTVCLGLAGNHFVSYVLPDDGRISLPLSATDDDTYPLGIAYCCPAFDAAESGGRLYFLSSDHVLCVYAVTSRLPGILPRSVRIPAVGPFVENAPTLPEVQSSSSLVSASTAQPSSTPVLPKASTPASVVESFSSFSAATLPTRESKLEQSSKPLVMPAFAPPGLQSPAIAASLVKENSNIPGIDKQPVATKPSVPVAPMSFTAPVFSKAPQPVVGPLTPSAASAPKPQAIDLLRSSPRPVGVSVVCLLVRFSY